MTRKIAYFLADNQRSLSTFKLFDQKPHNSLAEYSENLFTSWKTISTAFSYIMHDTSGWKVIQLIKARFLSVKITVSQCVDPGQRTPWPWPIMASWLWKHLECTWAAVSSLKSELAPLFAISNSNSWVPNHIVNHVNYQQFRTCSHQDWKQLKHWLLNPWDSQIQTVAWHDTWDLHWLYIKRCHNKKSLSACGSTKFFTNPWSVTVQFCKLNSANRHTELQQQLGRMPHCKLKERVLSNLT